MNVLEKFEQGHTLTVEELDLLVVQEGEWIRECYEADMAEEAEHRALTAEVKVLTNS